MNNPKVFLTPFIQTTLHLAVNKLLTIGLSQPLSLVTLQLQSEDDKDDMISNPREGR